MQKRLKMRSKNVLGVDGAGDLAQLFQGRADLGRHQLLAAALAGKLPRAGQTLGRQNQRLAAADGRAGHHVASAGAMGRHGKAQSLAQGAEPGAGLAAGFDGAGKRRRPEETRRDEAGRFS